MNSDNTVFEAMARYRDTGKDFAVATVVRALSPTSAKPGAKAIVDAAGHVEGWIGGGCTQPAVIRTAKQVLADGQPRLIRVTPKSSEVSEEGVTEIGMPCYSGGTLEIFVEAVRQQPVLLVIGESPAARTLASLAVGVGFDVVAAGAKLDATSFPTATRVVDRLDGDALAAVNPAFVVVATQGHKDHAGIEAALATQCPHIAMIASARKADRFKDELKTRGFESARVNAIVSPAGMDIGAVTPQEIALSVLASLVQLRRQGGPVTQTARRPAPDEAGPPAVAPDRPPATGECCGGGQ